MTHPRPGRFLLSGLVLAMGIAPAQALDLRWPEGASLAAADTPQLASFQIAEGPFDAGTVALALAEGTVSEQIWHVQGAASDPLILLRILREQLIEQGFEITYTCDARACGGFDFRHAVPIAVGADMHVDLTNYHYLAAARDGDSGTTQVALTVSAGGSTGFAHLAVVSPPGDLPPEVTTSTRDILEVEIEPVPSLAEQLATDGRAVLDDLSFDTGASSLSGTRYESLVELAAFLESNPSTGVALVGHTDAQGGLDPNIRLSRARAEAVRRFLIDELGVPASQVEAEGIGYLAPVSTNATPEGREANRRVEVVISTLPE